MSITNFLRCPRKRMVGVSSLITALSALSPLASEAQQPTPQQQSAIRQSCRSDFQASCAGVPTGGSEALQCLKQNFGKNSPGCQQALAPVMGGAAAPASGAAPATGAAPSTLPPSGGAASATPKAAVPARTPATNAGQGGMAGGGQPPTMREELMLTREMCGAEFRQYCANVPLGGGRGIQCLEANAASLSPRCKGALTEIRGRSSR